jgi:hypothetical protein
MLRSRCDILATGSVDMQVKELKVWNCYAFFS